MNVDKSKGMNCITTEGQEPLTVRPNKVKLEVVKVQVPWAYCCANGGIEGM